MRGISRRVLARDAAARVEDARCAGLPLMWSALESQHSQAATPEEAAAIVDQASTIACDGCPAFMACAAWARVENYSGLAAGAAYESGERRPADWVALKKTGRPAKVAS